MHAGHVKLPIWRDPQTNGNAPQVVVPIIGARLLTHQPMAAL